LKIQVRYDTVALYWEDLDRALWQLGLILFDEHMELLPHHHVGQVNAACWPDFGNVAILFIRTIRAVRNHAVANIIWRNTSPVIRAPMPVVTTTTGRWAVDLIVAVTAVIVSITNPRLGDADAIRTFMLSRSTIGPVVAHLSILIRTIAAVGVSIADPPVVKALSIVALETGSSAWIPVWIASFDTFVTAVSTVVVKVTNPSC